MKSRIAILSSTIFAGALAGAAVFAAVGLSDATPGDPAADAGTPATVVDSVDASTGSEPQFAVTQSSIEQEGDEHQHDEHDHHEGHDDDHHDSGEDGD